MTRRIRVLIGMLGLDQHEIGAIAVSRMLRDEGMEVVYAGKFNTPQGITRTSLEEEVDVIGLSCHSWEYLYYVPQLLALLMENGLKIPVIIGGSVITPRDAESLIQKGVAGAFGPGHEAKEIVETVKRVAALPCSE